MTVSEQERYSWQRYSDLIGYKEGLIATIKEKKAGISRRLRQADINDDHQVMMSASVRIHELDWVLGLLEI